MSSLQRRYEILLPLRFNDGQPVPEDLIIDTIAELERKFQAVSWESQVTHGRWQYEGQTYRDELVRVFVDVSDKQETRKFFVRFKKKLKQRFQQLDIRMTTYLVEEI